MTAGKRGCAALAAALFVVLFAVPSHADLFQRKLALYTGAAGDTTAVGMADSTSWKGTNTAQRMWLFLKPNRPCRVAIAIYAGDTTAAALDTTNTAPFDWHGGAYAASQTAGSDSVLANPTLYPTSDAAASYELIYTFQAAGTSKWGSPRGRWIPIRAADGTWYTAKMTRVRLRTMSASGVVTWTSSLHLWAW